MLLYYAVNKSDVYKIFTTKFYVNVMRPVFNNYEYSGYMSVISDNGEFKSNDMKMFCNDNGIKQNFTCPYTPEHNAPIERLFRTLDMMCNAMMAEKNLRQGLWQYVHEASAYLYNRIPSRDKMYRGSKSLEELFYGIKPSVSHVRVIGSKAFVHIPAQTQLKDHKPKAIQGILVGFSEDQIAGYKILNEADKEILYRAM